MSTVLTNGIIIPDNGSRNWGGDLANNWNILDVNVGYMTDVKNRVTTLENSVAENTANIQINASNISALQTSKQDKIEDLETIRSGASAGATAVQPSELNNYVDLSSEQAISGAKTFISLHTQSNGPSLWMKNTSFTMGTAPSTNRYCGLWIQDNNDTDAAYIVHQANKNNSQNLKFSVSNTDGSNTYQNALTFQGKLDGTFNFYSDNPANLGTTTNKWKTFNGINPGALSLPNYSQSVTLSFAINSPIEIPFDGFIKISFNISNYSYFSIFVNDQEAYIGQSATKPTVSALMPVSQNDIVKIQVVDGEFTGYGSVVLFKNKGNV